MKLSMETTLLETVCREAEPLLARARGRRIVVWGAGEVGAWLMGRLGPSGVAFVDKNPLKHGARIAGRPVFAPAELAALERDEVWVAVLSDVESVRAELRARGLVEGQGFRVPFAAGKRAQFLAGLPRTLAFLTSFPLTGARVLEVGYGGQLFLALSLLGLGAERVVVSDVAPGPGALGEQRAAWLAFLAELGPRLPSFSACEALRPEDLLARLCVHPEPAPAARLPFADASFDVVANTGVLEHVDDPEGAVRELARVLRPGGRALCAAIGLHDHRANDPRSGFSPWSFLTIPAERWRAFGANAYHQNRWRAVDFRRAFERHGFALELCWSVADPRLCASEVATFAESYRSGYTLAELAELDLWIAARKL